MAITALVPEAARPFFPDDVRKSVEPVFYTLHSPTLAHRFKKKLGLSSEQGQLQELMRIGLGELADIQIAWLGPDYRLNRRHTGILLNTLPNLRWIYSQAAGMDHLPLDIFSGRGIALSNSGTLVSQWVAEMIVTAILCQAKRIPEHGRMQRKARWNTLYSSEFNELTVGIVGSGAIATRTAELCGKLGMKTLGTSRDPGRPAAPFCRLLHTFDELDTLLRIADFVVLAVPLTNDTRGLIGAAQLARMKSTATLINYSRSAVVRQADLFDALRRRRIAACYTDFLEKSTLINRLKARRMENLILTHNSSAHLPRKLERAFVQFLEGAESLEARRF